MFACLFACLFVLVLSVLVCLFVCDCFLLRLFLVAFVFLLARWVGWLAAWLPQRGLVCSIVTG